MPTSAKSEFAGRERASLECARVDGYLNATKDSRQRLMRAHSFWCWRLRVPLVWFARQSPRSKYSRLQLELFTTANVLNERGRAELTSLSERLALSGRAVISPYEAVWEDVPSAGVEELARIVFRMATRVGNYELRQRSPSPEIVKMMEAIGNPVPWRISA